MTYEDLGYSEILEAYRQDEQLEHFEVGRVSLEHKERYIVKTPEEEYDSELVGNLRFMAESRYELPAVGDWVAISKYDDGKALIHAIYPRQSIIERQAVGKVGQVQIIATNIDFGLIVQAVDRDFSINRIERYLTICNASNVTPIIVLSKIDLISADELQEIKTQINTRIADVTLIMVSSITEGFAGLQAIINKGKTYCLLGSSGVGKSTMINAIAGKELMKTGEISDAVQRGKHITTHRELLVLENGGIFIDNPGMREVGITNTSTGVEITFDHIFEYGKNCKFKDCTHLHEKECAVIEAVECGEIDADSYSNFIKMQKEKQFFESDLMERKKKDKDLGKLIKKFQKQKRSHKY